MSKDTITPLMRQYYEIKNSYPDTIVMFQVGDFYELFFQDAVLASGFLGITLTKRGIDADGNPIPLCGVPVHVVQHYVNKLVRGGFKVAICDQLEVAKSGKIIKRAVTQVLTPGTLIDAKLLDDKTASYLCSFAYDEQHWSLIFVEILTGQMFVTSIANKNYQILEAELGRFIPDEILIHNSYDTAQFQALFQKWGYVVTKDVGYFNDSVSIENSINWFLQQFVDIDFDINILPISFKYALNNLYNYLKKNNENVLSEFKQLLCYQPEDFLMLDAATQKNLELVKNLSSCTVNNTLFSVLDLAVTSMGSRTIKKWILRPLISLQNIENRLDAVSLFYSNSQLKDTVRLLLKIIGDIERCVGRISLNRVILQDYIELLNSLPILPDLYDALIKYNDIYIINNIVSTFENFEDLYNFLSKSINTDNTKEWLVQEGFSAEIDKLRNLVENGAQAVAMLEIKEQTSTKINSLKIRYNGVHGYGIEITKPNLHLVPAHYIRVQTLANRERFTTHELKDLEYDILRARGSIDELEKEAFESIKNYCKSFLPNLKKLASSLATLDALQAFGHLAYNSTFVRPAFNDSNDIIMDGARHAVVEKLIGSRFIPNNLNLTNNQSSWIITGPNMGGKSTYLRQAALICIMAQIGSFVPAKSANLSIVDRIFTRIGAADNVAEGKSTFLVEMEETALICNQATSNSLVILDEVGRGTSTYDGLAIAQAVLEYIHLKIKARCLFATHYHELSKLSFQHPGIVCYYAASTKTSDGIILLHKILPGIASESFGLEVAKSANLPLEIVSRASQILIEGLK